MGLKLTARDRQLLAVLAEARCLAGPQVRRLFWPAQAIQQSYRRLTRLSSGRGAVVKALTWHTREGKQLAWTLTAAGYIEAEVELEAELDAARDDVGVDYLEHHVLLTEVYVGLLAAGIEGRGQVPPGLTALQRAKALQWVHVRAAHPAFKWTVTGDRELPWRQPENGVLRERVLRPDAILEYPQARRRFLIESEMGTHTISAVSPWKPGATTAKADRYEAFASGLASTQPRRTWYQARFPDGARPEVLFLVRSEGRAKTVEKALEEWRRKHATATCTFRAGTVAQVMPELLSLAGYAPSAKRRQPEEDAARTDAGLQSARTPDGAVQLTEAEAEALRRFFHSTHADFKKRRDMARTQRAQLPEYPEGMQEMQVVLKRLSV